ncbi:hypothetical protein N072000002_06030 [Clostridium tetani]|uniref:DUF4258 domain-containing protein n=1 Tax=Clostridium tetani TaxID=1513 RepID=A0ABC8EB04_CLOTA|nr:hypothetical protein K234311028_05930 [Clostridium tetani]BDR88802.1 hypothetical protein N072000002_06030 [Clostridium tetani]SUY65800.1 Uncharacterised protein [Clostridium tetani]
MKDHPYMIGKHISHQQSKHIVRRVVKNKKIKYVIINRRTMKSFPIYNDKNNV